MKNDFHDKRLNNHRIYRLSQSEIQRVVWSSGPRVKGSHLLLFAWDMNPSWPTTEASTSVMTCRGSGHRVTTEVTEWETETQLHILLNKLPSQRGLTWRAFFCTESEAVEGAVKSLELQRCSSYTVSPYLLVYISEAVMIVEAGITARVFRC